MKILLVGDYPNDVRLGSAKVPIKLAESLRELGHDCDLLFAENLGRSPKRMHPRQFVAPVLADAAVARAWKKNGPYDVVDIASGEGALFGLRRRMGCYASSAFVSRSHGMEHLNYRRMLDDHRHGLLHKPISRRIWYPAIRLNQVGIAARTAHQLVVLNEADRDFASSKGWKREDHISVVPHGVSKRFIDNAPAEDEERGAGILHCGTWTEVKGVNYLVPAFTALIDKGIRTRLTILGGAIQEETIRAAFADHVQKHVSVIQRLPEQEVIEQYRRHDVLAFSSTYEGFGMVLLEAMSQRLPVVTTPVGCALSLVRNNENGLVVPPRDPDSMARALEQLISNREFARRLAENAYRAVQHHHWTNTAENTLAAYESALRNFRNNAA